MRIQAQIISPYMIYYTAGIMEIREATKTLEDFLIMMNLFKGHRKDWDCSWDELTRNLYATYIHPMTRGWIYYVNTEPTGFMIAKYNRGVVNQIEAVAGNVKKIGIFKKYARAMIAILQDWCVAENAKRIVFNATEDIDVWKRHLMVLQNDRFPEVGIKEKITITWECGEGG
jgi:hypothetical protein